MLEGGTSAGAIQAALLAVGYSAQEIIDVVNVTPVQRLNDSRFLFFSGTHRLMKQHGWYRGDEFSAYFSELVALENLNPVAPADWQRIISINFLGFSLKIKQIFSAQKQQLMASGWACRRFSQIGSQLIGEATQPRVTLRPVRR